MQRMANINGGGRAPGADRVPVLIVGGGVAGLSASIMLSRMGVNHILVERRREAAGLPKAHIVSAKTMEIFRQLGLDELVYRAGSPLDRMERFNWMTSLSGPTPLHGREIGYVDSWGGGDDVPRYARATPCVYTNLSQTKLEPMLFGEAERSAPGRVRYGQELLTITQDEDGAYATLRDVTSGREWSIEADYVLAADAGRTVGPQIGVGWIGEKQIGQAMIVHFSADLHSWIDDPRVGISIFLSPDNIGHGLWSGALVKMGPTRWGTDAEEWVCHVGVPEGGIPEDEAEVVSLVQKTLGVPEEDFHPVIHSVNKWSIGGDYADRLHVGRILMIGDAAHHHPPAGGLGLNTAVADAQNATWKIAQVVKGYATPSLLHTYEQERQPVARTVVDQAVSTLIAETDAIVGVLGRFEQGAEGWEALGRLFSANEEGERLRASMAKMFRETNFGTRMLGVELGQQYTGSAVVPDGTEPPANEDPIREYVASTRPGHRVPHAWIERESQRFSTIDLAKLDRFVLVVDPAARTEWLEAIAVAAKEVASPIELVTVGEHGDYLDVGHNWADVNGLGTGGALLLRPDSFVGWRCATLPANASGALTEAVCSLLGRVPSEFPAAVSDHDAVMSL